MSTEQLSQRRRPQPRGDAKLVSYDEYIDTQVENTRRLVKLVDLATSLVMLAAAVLAFLLAAAVVEHWLVPGGFPTVVRAALFAMLAGGVGYFAYRRLWPLVIRAINPVYAAQAIEQTGPSLKNSLINLLLFRKHRSEISDAVYHTLEEQAAQRLSRVPVDAAVDRSLLIRFGYVLLAVVAAASLYKVLSPKDPWIAAQRVLMPWAEIVPASRVSISAVEPGSVTVARGEFVNVSAEVRGVGENHPVLLRFTTEDGQAVNKPLPMKLSKDELRFEARLPGGEVAAGSVGVTQDLRYRIEAGDARSLDYDVTAVAAPSILVERVEYEYPAYTGYASRDVEGLGDIRAIEGTRVTIHARANGPIQEAHIDFDADGRRDVQMTVQGTNARASFALGLREDRSTARHASYVLRFTNRAGQTNREPVKYAIHVEPDIAPEASIRSPEEKQREVRLDETVAIEVEAIDPDFALAEVRLRGEVRGRDVLNEPLLQREHQGRFKKRYDFTPSAHDLRAGDVMEYWVTANDNRTPQANSAASERQVLRIVSPDPAQQPPPDRLAQRDPRQRQQDQQPGEQQEQRDQQQDGQQQEGQGSADGQGGEPQAAAGAGEAQSGDKQQPQDVQRGDQPFSRDAKRSAEEGDKEAGGEDAPARSESVEEGAQQDQHAQPGERKATDKQTGAGAAGGEASQDGSQPAGTRRAPPEGWSDQPGARSTRPDGKRGEHAADGQRDDGTPQGDPSAEQAPVSSEGDNDAEAFERIRRRLQREGELPEGEPGSPDENRESFNRDAQRSAAEGQGDKERGRQGEGETGGEEKSPGDQDASADGAPGAGDEQQPQGAPESQPGMKPGEKQQASPSPRDQTDATEPPAGGRGKKESDSQGEQGGDRAGGGEEGGGQDAPRDGTGSAGQNQPADDGAGESTQQGTGSDSRDAGKDVTAEDRTGKSGGETSGRGSKTREGEGEQPGGESFSRDAERSAEEREGGKERGRQADKESGGEDAAERLPRDADEGAAQPGTATGGGGETGVAAGPPPRIEGTVPEGDEANLDYARKQTDLVLERLADQLKRKQVDEELLEELGWGEDDLRRFVERWQARKEAAQRNDDTGEAAKRELDEALRSLGLRRGPLKQRHIKDDTLRDLREGYRGAVPLEYQERLRAYNQGVSRARGDEE